MSYRMIEAARRLMCDKFSILCTIAELNAKQERNDKEDAIMNVKIKRLNNEVPTPSYAHEGDSGFDLVAAEDVIIEPGETVKVPTGLAFEIPEGYEIQVRPRSGITSKTKLRVQISTVDAGYRGEVSVIVDNISPITDGMGYVYDVSGGRTIDLECYDGTYEIRKGDRIAQAVIAPVVQANFIVVDELGETDRGEGGFGSTGVKESYEKAVELNGGALEKLAKEVSE